MRNRNERRELAKKKVKQREEYLKIFGERQGTCYKKQREKIEKNTGYLKKGHISHYANVGWNNNKTRKRDRYGKVLDYSPRDKKSLYRLEDEY